MKAETMEQLANIFLSDLPYSEELEEVMGSKKDGGNNGH